MRTEGGRELTADLATVAVSAPELQALDPRPAGGAGELIAVCMATYNPDPGLLRDQIASLRGQSDERWVCVISDDCSDPDAFEQIAATVAGDGRFAVSRSPKRLGFYRNFERALRLAPPGAELVALCDQDDRWHPDKLATLRAGLGGAGLVYSDQRLVTPEGEVLGDTLWRGRANNHTNLASMLVANSVTGAASLFRREIAELMLPFPDTPGLQFHDHWLGLVALAAGEVGYVDRPLYDYVQHEGAVFSEVSLGDGGSARGQGGRPWRAMLERWRVAYFYGYLAARCRPRFCWRAARATLTRASASARALHRGGPLARWPWRLWRCAPSAGSPAATRPSAASASWRPGRSGGGSPRRARAGRRQPGSRPVHASFPPVGPEAFEQTRLRRWRGGRVRGDRPGRALIRD